MKRRSFLRNGLLVAVALVMLTSMPLAVSADHVDDRDQRGLEEATPTERTGYTVPDDHEYSYTSGPVRLEPDDFEDHVDGQDDSDDQEPPSSNSHYICEGDFEEGESVGATGPICSGKLDDSDEDVIHGQIEPLPYMQLDQLDSDE